MGPLSEHTYPFWNILLLAWTVKVGVPAPARTGWFLRTMKSEAEFVSSLPKGSDQEGGLAVTEQGPGRRGLSHMRILKQ